MESTINRDLEIKEVIRRIALINAVEHQGKAQVKSVLGRLLAEDPVLRARIKEITPFITEIVQDVNRIPINEQIAIVKEKWHQALIKEKAPKEKVLPPLPNVDKYNQVVTRFAPNPDCVLHLGSARAIILSYEYAKIYNGRFILRFEDTDPRLKKSALQFFHLIKEDLKWLGCEWNAEFIQSDRLNIYYEYAEKLLRDGHAYVCRCKPKEFRSKISMKEPCPCRGLTLDENLTLWKDMLEGIYGEGEAVLRIKTDINHPNPALRDWPASRIIDTNRYPHPRVGDKYRVWPLFAFANGIDDHLMGITHIIRGKEHLTNQRRQEYLYQYLGWEYPEAIHYGRLKIEGASLSKSKILQGVSSGVYKGWDDPRLASFAALRRRGIRPEAIRRMIIEIGPRPVDIIVSWENLYAYNRKIIDPIANRFFFVEEPIKLLVKGISEELTIQISLHPEHPERGYRHFTIKPEDDEASFLISRRDLKLTKEGSIIRLMELLNVKIETVMGDSGLIVTIVHSRSYDEAKRIGAPLIHWIPAQMGIPCEVIMPDGTVKRGLVEDSFRRVHRGEVVQFERFGFVRVDDFNGKITVYFAHK